MSEAVFMLDLVKLLYWFDEQLQASLESKGWGALNRSQSLIIANIANGETRASRIADNLGVTRQAMSLAIKDLINKGYIETASDPENKRALVLKFSGQFVEVRSDARSILFDLESRLENISNKREFGITKKTIREIVAKLG